MARTSTHRLDRIGSADLREKRGKRVFATDRDALGRDKRVPVAVMHRIPWPVVLLEQFDGYITEALSAERSTEILDRRLGRDA